MEEIEELRAKAIASMTSSANPTSTSLLKAKSPDAREEGELSSGEDAELPSCSTAPANTMELPTCSTAPANTMVSDELVTATVSRRNLSQSTFKLNRASGSRLASLQHRPAVPRKFTKHFKTKQMAFKSGNSRTQGWHGKGADDSLVIVFSDGDAGSDSGESDLEAYVNRKENMTGLNKSGTKMPSARAKSGMRGLSSNGTKLMPNKELLTRPPVTSSVEKDSQIQTHGSVSKSSVGLGHEHHPDASLADNRLKNLRHQIAMRENELKVQNRSSPQRKDIIVSLYNDQQGINEMNVGTEAAGVRRPASASTEMLLNVRATKRLKSDENSGSKKHFDCHLHTQVPPTSDTSRISIDRNLIGRKENDMDQYRDKCHQYATKDGANGAILSEEMGNNEPLEPVIPAALTDLHLPSNQDSFVIRDVSTIRAIPVVSSKMQNQSLCLLQTAPISGKEALDSSDMAIRRNSVTEIPRCSNIPYASGIPQMVQNEAAKSGVRVPMGACNHDIEERAIDVPDNMLHKDKMNDSEMGSLHLESLMELEELQDRELEAAQELRRRCEVEERRVLKIYRKAQRALVDANERCNVLYRKRELFSSQLQALVMESSSSMWPSNWQNQRGCGLNYVKSIPNNKDPLSSMGHQRSAEGHTLGQLGYKYKDQCADGGHQRTSGHNFGSDQFWKPDASTSEPRDNSGNGICAAGNHMILSTEKDNVHNLDNRSIESRLASDATNRNYKENFHGFNVERDILPSSEKTQDYGLLEATLRSELVARLSMRTSSKGNDIRFAEFAVDKGTDGACKNGELSNSHAQQLLEGETMATSGPEGTKMFGRSNTQLTERFHHQFRDSTVSCCDKFISNVDVEENNFSSEKICCPSDSSFSPLPSSILHIVSSHLKFMLPSRQSGSCGFEENGCMSPEKEFNGHAPDVVECNNGYSLDSSKIDEVDSHMHEPSINPFWPFCMFELRGKCNDEECSWQHIKQCNRGNSKDNDHRFTSSSDGFNGCPFSCGRCSNPYASPNGLCDHMIPVPTYQIGSSLINVDPYLSLSVLARSCWLYWQREFYASYPLPFSVQKDLPDTPFLQSSDGPVADDCSRNELSSYSESQEGTLADSEQALEKALGLFDWKPYKSDRKKALSVLSRAIEADPSSVVLWIIYLHIFYREEKSIGKDDMFFHAVQHNQGSYELWLMYINSRVQLGDRLSAYVNALNAFCQRKDTFDKDRKYMSACVLDIFVQMIDFLCMSGNVDKAIWRIYRLLPSEHLENSCDNLLSDVHSCLIISDKCIFWICCIYVAIYGKLPEQILQQFEFEKDLPFQIEWPSQLISNRKDQALELIKVAVDDVALNIDVDFHTKDQSAIRSLHFLAVSHVRCAAALEGYHCSADLLFKYVKLYPECIELVLLAARMQENCTGNDALKGFEEALCNWPKENPGLQCLWNQYAEHAINIRGIDFVEKLMTRWYQGFRSNISCSDNLDGKDASISSSEMPSHVQSVNDPNSSQEDDAFRYLNLSLYKLLQKNLSDAQVAMDKALEHASTDNFKHVVREHAVHISSTESNFQKVSCEAICSLLNKYLGDFRYTAMLEPLSRRYCQNIKKPKIQQLVNKLLDPVSADSSLLNSILEACYGPFLLPQNFREPEILVDFIESVMEFRPGNYKLALSVYGFIDRNFSGAGFTSGAIRLWISFLLVNSVMQAFPVAPEYVWLQSAKALKSSSNVLISLRFHQQAISVYPFSVQLWQSYLDLSRVIGNTNAVVEAARKRGVELRQILD